MIPKNLLYTKTHEWVLIEDNIATVGITHYAQDELGDIVYIELPTEGTEVESGNPIGVIESVKAVADLYSPFTGKIVEVNSKLNDEPELVNKDPYGEGWIVKIEIDDLEEKSKLMSPKDYEEYLKEEAESH